MKLVKEDLHNIDKWIVAAGMMIEGGIRTPWTDSEQATFKKLDQLKREPRVFIAEREGLMADALPDHAKRNMMYAYVSRNGSKITNRKCCLDPDKLCDMLCSDFKIRIRPFHHTSGGQSFYAECFCTKFEPSLELEILKIHPLEAEE